MLYLIKNKVDKIDAFFYLIFFFFSILFIALLIPYHPYTGSLIIKSIPALSLSAIALKNIKGSQGKFLFVGLLFSAAGDISLDLDREKYFIPGLALFLMAHVFYIVSMAKDYKFETIKIIPAALLIISSSTIAYVLRDIPQKMLIPVMIYIFIISLMALCALFMNVKSYMIFAGAALFIVSDTILAVNKFINPIPHSTLINIGIYYAAQLLIVTGFMRGEKQKM